MRNAMLVLVGLVVSSCQSNPPTQKTIDASNYCFTRYGNGTNYDSCVYARQMGMEVTPAMPGR